MRTLLPYLKPYRKECVLSPLFKMFEALLELLVPLLMARIIDQGILARDTGYVLRMGLLLVGLGLLGFGVSSTAQYFAAKAAVGFAEKLRSSLFAHIQRFSYTELDTLGTPTLINRMTADLNQVQTGVNMTLRLLLRSPFIVVGAMLMAFTVDAKVALIFAALIPVLAIAVVSVMRVTLPRHKRVQSQLDRVLLHTRENLTGVRVLRAFDKQNDEIALFERENGLLCDMQRGVGRISALMNPLTYVLVNSALIVLLWNGAWQVQGGLLTQGAMVALVNYLSQILVELIKLANLIVTITKALACATRIETVLQQQPSMLEPEAPTSVGADTPECICFRNVSARYQGAGGDALTDVSFTALRAQTIGVIGGTGSGKSTLCSLIPRFYDATAGEVRVNGVNVKEQPLDALRQKIGVVPQKAVLFQGTIRDNLRWGKQSATDEELWRALHIAQAAEVVRGKALGLDEPVEQNGRNLSGGQRQRLTIARALVKQPEVLILDDSASALDYATDAALRKALRELPIPATVFVISQRASSVRFADLILVLDDGRLVGSGTHEALLRDCPIYQEIYYSQYPKEAV
ncbi:MAG: ABC transporter ATP-binding protein [Clostridia bacterium]